MGKLLKFLLLGSCCDQLGVFTTPFFRRGRLRGEPRIDTDRWVLMRAEAADLFEKMAKQAEKSKTVDWDKEWVLWELRGFGRLFSLVQAAGNEGMTPTNHPTAGFEREFPGTRSCPTYRTSKQNSLPEFMDFALCAKTTLANATFSYFFGQSTREMRE